MSKHKDIKHGKHAANKKDIQDKNSQPEKTSQGKHAYSTDSPTVKEGKVSQEKVASDKHEATPAAFETSPSLNKQDSLPLKYAPVQDFDNKTPFYSQNEFELPQEKKKKSRIALKLLIGFLVVLVAAYVGAAVYFSSYFMPNTTIADVDISLMSVEEATSALHGTVRDYVLSVEGQGFSYQVSADDINLTVEDDKTFEAVSSHYNPWKWPIDILASRDFSDYVVVSYDKTVFSDSLTSTVNTFNETATPPTVTAVAFDEATNLFVVKPAAVGTALDSQSVLKVAQSSVESLNSVAALTTEQLAQPETIEDTALMEAAVVAANAQLGVDLTLTMGGTIVGQVNSKLLSQWMVFPGDGTAALNNEAITAWANELAVACTTIGTERTYTRADGKAVVVGGGSYGWEVDAATLQTLVQEAVTAKRVETVAVPTFSDAAVYNGLGAQDWGARYVDIDLSEQYARMYDETGALIWESPIVSGKPNGYYDTPTGVYYITNKGRNITLTGYENGEKIYESKVSYWMPFVGNVYGLHDASWQYAFGGTRYRDGYGSHGCVNLPVSQAAILYDIIQNGDVVISHW